MGKARAKRRQPGALTVREFARLGGVASARALTSDGRTARARHAARVRWDAVRSDEQRRAARRPGGEVRRYGTATQGAEPVDKPI